MATAARTEAAASSVEKRLDSVLREVPVAFIPPSLTFRVTQSLQEFLKNHQTRHDEKSTTNKRSYNEFSSTGTSFNTASLAEAAAMTAETFCQMAAASNAGRLAVRRSLEQASRELLCASPDIDEAPIPTDEGFISVISVGTALAFNQESDGVYCRAAASAMSCTLQKLLKTRDDDQSKPACSIIQTLLIHTASHCKQNDSIQVDWHIVTTLARALGMDASRQNGKQTRQAVADIVTQILCLDSTEANDNGHINDDLLPEKVQVAAALALAAQMKPWPQLSPASLIQAAVPHDLWHAAERVCDATEGDGCVEAVESLIQAAMEAKLYRRADTFATRYYSKGGKSYYLEARLLHACDTVAKVVRKGAVPVIERQIDRVDKAAGRVLDDGVIEEATTAAAAKEEIRTFALQQLEESGNIDAAHRLASIYGLDYVYDEETLAAAAEARRKKYLQWDDVLPGSPPDLICTPRALFEAFSDEDGVYGFDVEWSEDDAGADLLQIAMPTGSVVLLDVPALSMTLDGAEALQQTVGRLFACQRSTVVGFGCRQDLSKLRSSPCARKEHWLGSTSAVVDMQKLVTERDAKLRGLGLSRLCDVYLGKPLDKSEQCSFWSARPLSLQQRVYAALDAWVCLAIHGKLIPHSPGSTT